MPDGASASLVTGATGMVGAALVRQLVSDGHDVRILARTPLRLELLSDLLDRLEVVEGDVTDLASVRGAVRGAAQVWHVAGLVDMGGKRSEARLFEVNEGGTANVVDAVRDDGRARLLHVSSIAAIGRRPRSDEILDEQTPWVAGSGSTAYARSKRAAEMQVHRGIAEGVDAVIVNPALIFGRGRPGEGTMRIVERVRAGGTPVAPAGGTCFVDVEDVAAGMRAAMTHGRTGERYILGGENLSWLEALGTLAGAFGVRRPSVRLPPALLTSAAVAAEALARMTGAAPRLTLEQARTASRFHRYSNRKAREDLGLTFRPFVTTARRLAGVQ